MRFLWQTYVDCVSPLVWPNSWILNCQFCTLQLWDQGNDIPQNWMAVEFYESTGIRTRQAGSSITEVIFTEPICCCRLIHLVRLCITILQNTDHLSLRPPKLNVWCYSSLKIPKRYLLFEDPLLGHHHSCVSINSSFSF